MINLRFGLGQCWEAELTPCSMPSILNKSNSAVEDFNVSRGGSGAKISYPDDMGSGTISQNMVRHGFAERHAISRHVD
jgi:hypothetical protein